jgi:8-hydroxy-5-deazaflavin:NADPH oxidoreductase
MDITIIGTGNMARGIARRALAGAHNVTLIGHAPGKAQTVAGELDAARVQAGDPGDPITGDVVVLAVPYGAFDDVVASYGSQLSGKVVVDITNPVDFSTFSLIEAEAGSAAQELAQKAPGAKVVKAFNTTFATTLREGKVAGQPLDVFVASDDDDAKAAIRQLVEDSGLRAVDAGLLARARQLEGLAFLHMAVQQPLGTGFSSAVKIIA